MSDPTVTITKTAYTKFVDASVEAFTAQTRGTDGMEIRFADAQPAADVPGVRVPGGLPYGVTRANGLGHGWAKLPADAIADSAMVVIG